MSTVSAQAIEESLKQCMDPEVPLNIVEMGLIYGIDINIVIFCNINSID